MAALNMPTPQYPLAGWIANINTTGGINTYTDWCIPVRDELELPWRNLKPNTSNNTITCPSAAIDYVCDDNTSTVPQQTAGTAFRVGGAEEIAGVYWSSSEFSSITAWNQTFNTSNPGTQNTFNKNTSLRARAVRRSVV